MARGASHVTPVPCGIDAVVKDLPPAFGRSPRTAGCRPAETRGRTDGFVARGRDLVGMASTSPAPESVARADQPEVTPSCPITNAST